MPQGLIKLPEICVNLAQLRRVHCSRILAPHKNLKEKYLYFINCSPTKEYQYDQ